MSGFPQERIDEEAAAWIVAFDAIGLDLNDPQGQIGARFVQLMLAYLASSDPPPTMEDLQASSALQFTAIGQILDGH